MSNESDPGDHFEEADRVQDPNLAAAKPELSADDRENALKVFRRIESFESDGMDRLEDIPAVRDALEGMGMSRDELLVALNTAIIESEALRHNAEARRIDPFIEDEHLGDEAERIVAGHTYQRYRVESLVMMMREVRDQLLEEMRKEELDQARRDVEENGEAGDV